MPESRARSFAEPRPKERPPFQDQPSYRVRPMQSWNFFCGKGVPRSPDVGCILGCKASRQTSARFRRHPFTVNRDRPWCPAPVVRCPSQRTADHPSSQSATPAANASITIAAGRCGFVLIHGLLCIATRTFTSASAAGASLPIPQTRSLKRIICQIQGKSVVRRNDRRAVDDRGENASFPPVRGQVAKAMSADIAEHAL